ncbi:site-specific tyrosine recombinase XerD [Enemella sp. A6]|uniref:site-specific tyrosine recombinase XerD n=1 Tax=Enemella sp. A6 TaxID=3440152 RepID=UPI003EB91736
MNPGEPSARLTGWVQTFLDHLAVERGLSGNTTEAYRRDLTRYLDHLTRQGITEPAAITAEHVAGFAGYAADLGLADSSIARAVVAVRGLHRFALEEGTCPADPAADVRPPQQRQRLPKALSIAEVGELLATPDTSTITGLRDAALLELLYGTGARISEIVDLDVDDLTRVLTDPSPEVGLRLRGKGDKERVVPLGRYAREAVDAWLVRGRPGLAERAARFDPALLLNARGGRLSRQSAWAVLQRAAKAAGMDDRVSPHTLRHSYATHLIDGGADVRVVQELLGHASVTTTQIYTLVTIDHLREVYATAHPRARRDT